MEELGQFLFLGAGPELERIAQKTRQLAMTVSHIFF